MRVKIVGAGLIGTSIALALKQSGHEISLVDRNSENRKIAHDLLGQGSDASLDQPSDLASASLQDGSTEVIIIATPISQVFPSLVAEFQANPEATFIDICGLKSNLLLEVARVPGLNARFCSTHPMAGREISGPTAARADLFQGRPWIITPSAQTGARTISIARELASECGATIFEMAPEEHDGAIALISHLPQITASLLGSVIEEATGPDSGEQEYLSLSGQGLRDTIRLASSNSELWSELLVANRNSLLPLLEIFSEKLAALSKALELSDQEEVKSILETGSAGKARIPGKHGGVARNYQYLPIVIDDRPGQLARIFLECAQANVNIEDLMMEHSPGQETGLITLALSADDATKLYNHLTSLGWRAHLPRANAQ